MTVTAERRVADYDRCLRLPPIDSKRLVGGLEEVAVGVRRELPVDLNRPDAPPWHTSRAKCLHEGTLAACRFDVAPGTGRVEPLDQRSHELERGICISEMLVEIPFHSTSLRRQYRYTGHR